MRNSSLISIYHWGVRSAFYNQGPKELKPPWYDCDQRMEFEYGRRKGKNLAAQALITGQGGDALIERWSYDAK